MAEALRAADFARVGALLSENWERQQQLDPEMRTEEMARLEAAMAGAGVLGGKAAGAGAGGTMVFLTGDDRRPAVAAALAGGARVLPLAWGRARGRAAWRPPCRARCPRRRPGGGRARARHPLRLCRALLPVSQRGQRARPEPAVLFDLP